MKNTGRCRELLVPGAKVILEKKSIASRKTEYDLIAVYKGQKLVNIDSQAPNRAFFNYVQSGRFLKGITLVKPEYKYGDSRFDFLLMADEQPVLVEVKGVTLEEDGVVMFPDAPTERGVKHIRQLIAARINGFTAYVVFIIQMSNVRYFLPNHQTHQAFADVLQSAGSQGVNILAYDCHVTEDSIAVKDPVQVFLQE